MGPIRWPRQACASPSRQTDNFQLLVGVYNGDPARPCDSDDPQVCDNDGLDFELDDPPLFMVEGAYKYNQERLAGTVALAGQSLGTFENQRFDGEAT